MLANRTRDLDPTLSTFLNDREKLLILAQSIVKDRGIAEDLVQDSWVRWHGKEYPQDKISPILKRIVANLSKDWLRKKKTERNSLNSLKLSCEHELDSERIVISRQDLSIVVAALKKLPERTVAAFQMNRVEGLTFSQIAKHLDISPPRAHQLVRNALVHLALHLDY